MTTRKANSHASVGAMTGHVTGMTVLVVSPASARSATTNWEIGWLRTTGWIQWGNNLIGWRPTDSSPKIKIGKVSNGEHRVGVPGSGADQVRTE